MQEACHQREKMFILGLCSLEQVALRLARSPLRGEFQYLHILASAESDETP